MPLVPEEGRRRLGDELGYDFSDLELLETALMHRSYAAEHVLHRSYERLEFLGDAVLQLAVTDYLYSAYPDLAEGEMAKVRAAVVNERTLASVARRFDVGASILLGKGEEQTGGRDKDSILSDVMESLLGAIYLESGFEAATLVIRQHWVALVDERAAAPGRRDYKTRLQETLARLGLRPEYNVDESGPEHAKWFIATVRADGRVIGEGEGTSKKRAEQEAARRASDLLAEEQGA